MREVSSVNSGSSFMRPSPYLTLAPKAAANRIIWSRLSISLIPRITQESSIWQIRMKVHAQEVELTIVIKLVSLKEVSHFIESSKTRELPAQTPIVVNERLIELSLSKWEKVATLCFDKIEKLPICNSFAFLFILIHRFLLSVFIFALEKKVFYDNIV